MLTWAKKSLHSVLVPLEYIHRTTQRKEANEMTNEDLSYSNEYAEFIMANGDRLCCNGDMLTELMEELYLFDEFLASLKG